ncbi:anthranilate synthase component I family protein, partial [Helicobacter typhlonius]
RSSMPPLQAYRHLRHQNPSPYMFYYDFDDFVILGASPEIMIRLKSQNESSNFILRPIAGTRPRGKSVAEDKQLESQLLSDEKELSEHLMLLDLARNDAGKVSVGGGVEVVYRNKIERYSRVMHIVSQVQGELDSKRFAKRDAFKATFPAGTLSGAPKIEAIKNIERLESSARGIYGGAIGYFTYNEDMDFAIAIRSAVYQNGVYYVRSGAGVVQDSIPKSEFIETQNKVQSMLDMLAPKD